MNRDHERAYSLNSPMNRRGFFRRSLDIAVTAALAEPVIKTIAEILESSADAQQSPDEKERIKEMTKNLIALDTICEKTFPLLNAAFFRKGIPKETQLEILARVCNDVISAVQFADTLNTIKTFTPDNFEQNLQQIENYFIKKGLIASVRLVQFEDAFGINAVVAEEYQDEKERKIVPQELRGAIATYLPTASVPPDITIIKTQLPRLMSSDPNESLVYIMRKFPNPQTRNEKIQKLNSYIFHPIKIGDEYSIELTMRPDVFEKKGMSEMGWHLALSNELPHILFEQKGLNGSHANYAPHEHRQNFLNFEMPYFAITEAPSVRQIEELLSDMVTYKCLLSLPDKEHFYDAFKNYMMTFFRDSNDQETMKNFWFLGYALIHSLIGENFFYTINKIQSMPQIVSPQMMEFTEVIRSVGDGRQITHEPKDSEKIMTLIQKLPIAFFGEFLFNERGSPHTFLKQYLRELEENKPKNQ